MDSKRRIGVLSLTTATLAVLLLVSCGGGGGNSSSGSAGSDPPPAVPATQSLTSAQVDAVVHAAVEAVNVPVVVGVTDRLGNILAVFNTNNAPANGVGNFGVNENAQNLAIALARTAAFFSNDQAPLSSRTVRYISGIHFPPGVDGAPNAPLYGIENTNRGCSFNTAYLAGQAIPPATLNNGTSPGLGIITGKANVYDSDPTAVNPGGVPLFEDNTLVGGVGVVAANPDPVAAGNIAEYAAYVAATTAPFGPTPAPPGVVVINGIAVPFVDQTTAPSGVSAGSFNGSYYVGPSASPGPPPDGYLVGPMASAYSGGLSSADVASIVSSAVTTANQTRAVIRLPIGSRARMMIAVSDLGGNLLAVYRMPDATIFSIDVAVAKARNVVYFSNAGTLPGAYAASQPGAIDLPGIPQGTAVTNRTIGFGAQPEFPPGIEGSGNGPFFNLYLNDTANACTQGSQPQNLNQNGIVFFPGSLPLYRNGVLVGGLGVSGDGVDQDDFVTAAGGALMTVTDPSDSGHGFEAPTAIRADQIVIDNIRMPYLKFPRNPTQ
jgi:uncharacterized protein GlcG (DUF336 family)